MVADRFSSGDVRIVVDNELEIVPPGVLSRSMMSMARHPDGAIFLNTQTGPLYKSDDNGGTWTPMPVRMPHLAHEQVLHGLGISRDGRLWLAHSSNAEYPDGLYGQDLFVSSSSDLGTTWRTSPTNFGAFPPGIPNMMFHEDGNRTFIERPDGTLMFTTTITASPSYQKKFPPSGPTDQGGQPGDLFSDIIFRSTDGGETWGDPVSAYPSLNPHETNLAIDPNDPDHILLMARCQRALTPDEDPEEFMRRTGNPEPDIKQGVLLESTDCGRTFQEAGWTNYYGHRCTVYWAPSNVVIVTHNAGPSDPNSESDDPWTGPRPQWRLWLGASGLVARISLDGARSWVDGTDTGTPDMGQSHEFVLVPQHSFTTPTVELSPNHFLTTYGYYWGHASKVTVNGLFWHIEASV